MTYAKVLFFGLALTLTAASMVASAQTPSTEKPVLGTATIEPDGTIILHMFRTSDGRSALANLRYGVNTPHYKEVLDHIGSIKPGETKPVLPFDGPASEKN